MVDGVLEEVMMVDTPAAVAISEAISLVSIPPVPREEPSVSVLTMDKNRHKQRKGLVKTLSTSFVETSHERMGGKMKGANEP